MKSLCLTRRELLVRTFGMATAGLALKSGMSHAALSWAIGNRPPASGFKLGVCDWTLGKRTDPTALEMAERLGLDGVQVDLGSPEDDLPLRRPEVQQKYLQAARKSKAQIASLAIAAMNEVPLKSDPRTEQWVADSIGVCSKLGVRVVLLAFFAKGDLRNDPKGVDTVVQKLRNVSPQAEKAGVILGFESWLNADQHIRILDRVGSPALKVYYDVGNAHHEGYDIYKEIRFLGKHICEFHAKDYDGLYGKGSINFPEIRRAIDDIGYRGWIHIEGVKTPLGLEPSIRYDAEYLRRIFPSKV